MTSEGFNYYSIHDILKIKTNIEIPVPDYFNRKKEIDPDVVFSQEDIDIEIPRGKKRRCGFFSYWREGSALFIDYEVPLLNVKLIIDDLQGKTKVKFTKAYSKFAKVDHLLYNILQIKLIQKGCILIHAGCLNYLGEQCFLFSALGETGKTSTVLSLLDGKDFKFMSDDQTIISKSGKAYSYPTKVRVSPYTLTGSVISPHAETIRAKLAKSRLLILFSQYLLKREIATDKEVPHNLIEDKGIIKKVFILSGSTEKEEIREIDNTEALRKILITSTELLTGPFKRYQLQYYSFILDFDLYELFDRGRRIIREAIKDAECFELRANSAEKYPKMVKEVIE